MKQEEPMDVKEIREALEKARGALNGTEINMGNYTDDDVAALNHASTIAWWAIRDTLAALSTIDPEAIKREAEEWQAIKAAYRIEQGKRANRFHPNQYHGHAHAIDGIWDRDNGALAGCECVACMLHRAAILQAEPGQEKKV